MGACLFDCESFRSRAVLAAVNDTALRLAACILARAEAHGTGTARFEALLANTSAQSTAVDSSW